MPISNCNIRQRKPVPWVDFHRKFGIVKDVIEKPAKYIDPLIHACSMTPESWMGVAATAITASERKVDKKHTLLGMLFGKMHCNVGMEEFGYLPRIFIHITEYYSLAIAFFLHAYTVFYIGNRRARIASKS